MHLRIMWCSRAAANGCKCIRLEHPPLYFCYFSSQKSPPWPWSPTPLKTPNCVTPSHPCTEWYVRRPSAAAGGRDRPQSSRSPALNCGDGIAMIPRWRTTSNDEARKRYVTQILFSFPRRILLCAKRDASSGESSLQYLRYNTCNSLIFLHDYLRIIVHSIKRRLQQQPTFFPTYCSGN